MPMIRLIYFSENQIDPASGSMLSQLSNILSASNRNNKRAGITGALLFDDLWFIQVLEGDRAVVLKSFDRIKEDERHAQVTLVEMREMPDRIFGNWWMGLARRNDATEAAFLPYLKDGRLDPHALSARQMLALAIDVAKLGLSREVRDEAA